MHLTVKDASIKSKLSIKTIRRAIHSGELLAERVQNQLRIEEKYFYLWLENFTNFNSKKETFTQKPTYVHDPKTTSINKYFEDNYWNNEPKVTYNFIDLFSGAGGLGCGLCMAGFRPLDSVELNKEAVETYNYNFSKFFSDNYFHSPKNIKDPDTKNQLINKYKGKRIHLISGGFPCQGFSMSGHRVVADHRNNLYIDMLEIVNSLKPDFVLMENVLGLRSMLGGKIEQKIIEDYKKIGYRIDVAVLNSADYGVAQTRKRVIFIGNRLNLENYFPETLLNSEHHRTVRDAIEKFEMLPEKPEINHIFTKHKPQTIEQMKLLNPGESLYKNYSDSWKKTPYDRPSCTIKENHGGVNIHPVFPRVMTPRELAALQSFPDDFIFKGPKKSQLVQIGNAVPPLLGKAIGIAIIKSLKLFQVG